MYFRIRDNLTASIRFFIKMPISIFSSKTTPKCVRKHQLCLASRYTDRGANQERKAYLRSPRPLCWKLVKMAQYFLTPALSRQRGAWQCPAPTEGHRIPGRSSGNSSSSPAALVVPDQLKLH